MSTQSAQEIFDSAWKRCPNVTAFPKEIIWLGGAPGAGKGTHAGYVMNLKKFQGEPIVMSSLLDTPEMKKIKDAGQLISDADAVSALLQEMAKPMYAGGCIVDGFPRTMVQVDVIRLMRQKAQELAAKAKAPAPVMRALILDVHESIAVERQLQRGREVIEHNKKVRATGVGTLKEERATDMSAEYVAKRYRIFVEQSKTPLESMKRDFPFHLIDADGEIDEVDVRIKKSLESL